MERTRGYGIGPHLCSPCYHGRTGENPKRPISHGVPPGARRTIHATYNAPIHIHGEESGIHPALARRRVRYHQTAFHGVPRIPRRVLHIRAVLRGNPDHLHLLRPLHMAGPPWKGRRHTRGNLPNNGSPPPNPSGHPPLRPRCLRPLIGATALPRGIPASPPKPEGP